MFVTVLLRVFVAFVDVLQLFMLGRAIISWFPLDNSNRIVRFLYIVTEPAVIPLRALFRKLGWFQDMPIDMSFLLSFMLLSLFQTFASIMIS